MSNNSKATVENKSQLIQYFIEGIKKNNNPPIKPIGVFPSSGSLLNPKCIVFSGSSFIDPDADLQGASHWQISEDSLFNSVIYDEWIQHENWYFDQDLLSGNDMTDQEVKNLDENKTYYWRLRYRDRSLFWSDWSDFVKFQTYLMDHFRIKIILRQ